MRRPVVVAAAEVAPVPHTSAAIAADVPHNTLAAAAAGGSIAAVSPPSLSSPTNVEQFHEYRN